MNNIFFTHAITPMVLATIIAFVCLKLGCLDVSLPTKVKITILFGLWILISFIFSVISLAITPV